MRTVLAIAVAVGVASLILASASAGPPPPILLHVGVTHEQPAAGRLFTGLTFTPVGGARITQVVCDANVGHKALRGRQQRFYEADGSNLTAITCSWLIPAGAVGKRLHLAGDEGRAWVFVDRGTGQSTTIGTPVLFWRVQP